MPAEANSTIAFVKAQSIDIVNLVTQNALKLVDVLGIYNPVPIPAGTTIKTYLSKVTLDGTKVPKGAVIPLSQVKLEDGPALELNFDKKRKAVALEDIQKYGFELAIAKTDDALIKELQKNLRKQFFENLSQGTGTAKGEGLQMAMAQGWGAVNTAFEEDEVEVVGVANVMDVAKYMGEAQITTQTAFGMSYIENFLGTRVLLFSSQIPQGSLYMTAAGNLNFAYADVRGEASKVFDFVTDETGIIGITKDVDKTRLTAETTTVSATALYAERLDGVIKVTITEPAQNPAG